jgi:hypothetical protein
MISRRLGIFGLPRQSGGGINDCLPGPGKFCSAWTVDRTLSRGCLFGLGNATNVTASNNFSIDEQASEALPVAKLDAHQNRA